MKGVVQCVALGDWLFPRSRIRDPAGWCLDQRGLFRPPAVGAQPWVIISPGGHLGFHSLVIRRKAHAQIFTGTPQMFL